MDKLKFWRNIPPVIKLFIMVDSYFFGQVESHPGKLKTRILVRTGKLSSNLKLYTVLVTPSLQSLWSSLNPQLFRCNLWLLEFVHTGWKREWKPVFFVRDPILNGSSTYSKRETLRLVHTKWKLQQTCFRLPSDWCEIRKWVWVGPHKTNVTQLHFASLKLVGS